MTIIDEIIIAIDHYGRHDVESTVELRASQSALDLFGAITTYRQQVQRKDLPERVKTMVIIHDNGLIEGAWKLNIDSTTIICGDVRPNFPFHLHNMTYLGDLTWKSHHDTPYPATRLMMSLPDGQGYHQHTITDELIEQGEGIIDYHLRELHDDVAYRMIPFCEMPDCHDKGFTQYDILSPFDLWGQRREMGETLHLCPTHTTMLISCCGPGEHTPPWLNTTVEQMIISHTPPGDPTIHIAMNGGRMGTPLLRMRLS